MLRPDWAAGKIRSSGAAQTVAFPGSGVFRHWQRRLRHGAIAGIGQGGTTRLSCSFFRRSALLLVAFARGRMQQRRIEKCFLEMTRVPAPLGGKFSGDNPDGCPLETRARSAPSILLHPLRSPPGTKLKFPRIYSLAGRKGLSSGRLPAANSPGPNRHSDLFPTARRST